MPHAAGRLRRAVKIVELFHLLRLALTDRAGERVQECDERLLLFDGQMKRVNLGVDAGILRPPSL